MPPEGDAVQPPLPRVLPAKMALRAGHVSPVPHAALQVAPEVAVVADEGRRTAALASSSATAARTTTSAESARPTRGRGGGGRVRRAGMRIQLDTFAYCSRST